MTFSRLLAEVSQGPSTRRDLYSNLEKKLGKNKRVIALFTSFRWPVALQDEDATMLEEVLQNAGMDKRELVLILNSPGGEALPAERIVNICRSFSNKGSFSVIVPKMAKSAATMVCLGASKIAMSKTSELGPIDPQIGVEDEDGNIVKYLAAHEIIESYKELMRSANRTRGRIEPFLQQLQRFDARDIRRMISAQKLSESIAVNSLRGGALKGLTPRRIKNKIKAFLDPKYTKVHGRPIYHDVATKCGLNIKLYDIKDPIWQLVWKLYIRLDYVVSHDAAKVVESSQDSYSVSIPPFVLMEAETKTGRER